MKPSLVDQHLQKLPTAERAVLEHIRQLVKNTAPETEEVITYAMPGFKYQKKYLIAYEAFADHLSIFPGAGAIATLKDELRDYKTAKGTVQFTLDKPLSDELIRQLVLARIAEIES